MFREGQPKPMYQTGQSPLDKEMRQREAQAMVGATAEEMAKLKAMAQGKNIEKPQSAQAEEEGKMAANG